MSKPRRPRPLRSEELESRQLLTNNLELLFDFNQTPVSTVVSDIWESADNRLLWLTPTDVQVDGVTRPGTKLYASDAGQLQEVYTFPRTVFMADSDAEQLVLHSTGATKNMRQAWVTDGSTAGTVQVEDVPKLKPDTELEIEVDDEQKLELRVNNRLVLTTSSVDVVSPPSIKYRVAAGRLFFTLPTAQGNQIWVTEGSNAYQVDELADQNIIDLAVVDEDLVYIVAEEGGPELWRFAADTADIVPQRITQLSSQQGLRPQLHFAADSTLYGSTPAANDGHTLWQWRSDQAGISPIAVLPGEPTDFSSNAAVHFSVNEQPWVTDGHEAAPRQSSTQAWGQRIGGYYIGAEQAGENYQLQSRLGIAGEPVTLASSDTPWDLSTTEDNRVFFVTGRQLWQTDGTPSGTRFTLELPDVEPHEIHVAGEQILVRAERDLYVKTTAATEFAALPLPIHTGDSRPQLIGQVENGFLVSTRKPQARLWGIVGDKAELLLDNYGIHHESHQVGGATYFLASKTGPPELWRTQGTQETTESLPLPPRASLYSTLEHLYAIQHAGPSGAGPTWIWEPESMEWTPLGSDFTEGSKREVLQTDHFLLRFNDNEELLVLSGSELHRFDLQELGQSLSCKNWVPHIRNRLNPGVNFYFTMQQDDGQHIVHYIDADLQLHVLPGSFPGRINFCHAIGNGLVAMTIGLEIGAGPQVWQTDGGLPEKVDWPRWDAIGPLARIGERTIYMTYGPPSGAAVHSTDGTPEGTLQLIDELVVPWFSQAGDYVYLDSMSGVWRTAGTPETTLKLLEHRYATPHHNLRLHAFGRAFPAQLTSDGDLVLIAQTAEYGHELYRLELPESPSEPPLVGDLDADNDVDFADFLLLSSHYGATGVDAAIADLTDDGSVDFADFLLLSANFGKSRAE